MNLNKQSAEKEKNIKEVADALTDILYVTYESADCLPAPFGIDLDKCFDSIIVWTVTTIPTYYFLKWIILDLRRINNMMIFNFVMFRVVTTLGAIFLFVKLWSSTDLGNTTI